MFNAECQPKINSCMCVCVCVRVCVVLRMRVHCGMLFALCCLFNDKGLLAL